MPTGPLRYAPNQGPLWVSAVRLPMGANEVGVVEASGTATIEELMREFTHRAAMLGGNFAKVDRIATRFEMVTQSQSYSYACGRTTCSGTRTVTVEVATTQVVGRAMQAPWPIQWQ